MSETASELIVPEFRYVVAPITHVDVREPQANDDNTWTMSGYAAVFNEATTLYDGRFLKLTEEIAPTAFDRVLRDQGLATPEGVVHFNFGHDMNRAVAATDVPAGQPGSLQLRADAHGLGFLAKVPRDDPDGVAMAVKMRTGVLRQASFAFNVGSDKVEIEETDERTIEHRTILELSHLYDVCTTPQGAYSQTVTNLRSLAAALGQPVEGGQPRQSVSEGATVVTPTEGESGGAAVNSNADALRAELRELVAQTRGAFKPRKVS